MLEFATRLSEEKLEKEKMGIRSAKKCQLAKVAEGAGIKLVRELGAGGNARVYSGENDTGGSVAIKFMLNDDTKRYDRFRDEVLVVTTTLQDSKHVVPILDHSLPGQPLTDDVFPWYSMPVAQKFSDSMSGKSWRKKLMALVELADGLVAIHALNVAHRDIKPDNLFELDGSYRFGDFGIASFPDKSGLTRLNEPMGPWAFMAPEMLHDATTADPFKADVYAFAKTVWCVLTEKKIPFIGIYVADSADGLVHFSPSERFTFEPLDELLERSTHVSANQRPSVEQFADELKNVIAVQDDFSHTNSLQWQAAEIAALRTAGLTCAVWTGAAEIAEVLTLLARRDGMNHCFFPNGGGQTITESFVCEGGEMVALRLESMALCVVKPVRLTLERFPGNPKLSYTILETASVAPLGADERYISGEAECLWRLNDHDYAVDDPDETDPDTPRNADNREYCKRRFKGGDFIIAPTTGLFNHLDDYMGTEGKASLFRALLEKHALNLENKKNAEAGSTLRRKVRLLHNPTVAGYTLELEHIDSDLLKRLIEADDVLVSEQNKGKGVIISGDKFADYILQPSREKTSAEQYAWQLISDMTTTQKAELMTLMDLARGRVNVWGAKERTMSTVRENMKVPESYLLDKFGNGYLRKALACYGLELSL